MPVRDAVRETIRKDRRLTEDALWKQFAQIMRALSDV
jgi:hypothetical protein